jgi:WD40 repeat protein
MGVIRREWHTGGVVAITFMLDGKHIISGGREKTVRVWNVETSEVDAPLLESYNGAVGVNYTHRTMLPWFGDSSKLVDGWILGPNSELLF